MTENSDNRLPESSEMPKSPGGGYTEEDFVKSEEPESPLLSIGVEKKEEIKSSILSELQDWCHAEQIWESGFENIAGESDIQIGKVITRPISTDPDLYFNGFLEKRPQKSGKMNQAFYFMVTERPLGKQDLLQNYDECGEEEIVSFGVEFGYDRGDGRSDPNRHSLKHRLIKEPFLGGGFGTEILNTYEGFFDRQADSDGPNRNVIDTYAWSTLRWAAKNGYEPEGEDDQIVWNTLQKEILNGENSSFYIRDDKVYDADGNRLYVRLKKDFGAPSE